ncbi:MAG: HAD family phosphatase [Lachnospiraceae bacterium]|nr:HAD family phosphatase [Lachnospiraceae bacterium]
MIHAVIFDMDGILIDTEKYLYQYWKQATQEAGYELTHEQLLRFRSFSQEYAEPYFQELLGADFDFQSVRKRRIELMSQHYKTYSVEKKPQVDEFLDWLAAHGYKKAVSTAAALDRTKEHLTQVGIYDRFDQIACAPSVPHGKPMPDVYLHACEQIGEKPEHCLALEDSDNGALSAHRAGCKVVMVRDLADPLPETARFLEGTADNLLGVIPILERLAEKKESKEEGHGSWR